MNMEKKVKTHKFFDKNPVAGAVLLAIYGMILVQVIVFFVDKAIPVEDVNKLVGAVVASLVVLLIHKCWFRPEFEGNLRGGRLTEGFGMLRIFVVFWVISLIVQVFFSDFELGLPTLSTVSVSVAAGFTEETAFRGLPLSMLMRKFAKGNRIYAALIITSVVFGLVHGLNVFVGANIGRTGIQMIGAGFMGLLLGAIYLRSGNLWPVIVIHTAHDIIAMLDVSNITDKGVIVGQTTWHTYFDLGLCVAMGIAGLYLVRKAKRAEIDEIWSRKWVIAEDGYGEQT